MAKPKTAHAYELELRKMITERNGACGVWLNPQIRATAANMVMIDKVQDELLNTDKLVGLSSGSMKQIKQDVNPLMPYYLKLIAELRLQYEALGLNYKTTPAKIKESTKRKSADENNPMYNFYKQLKK